MSKKRIPKIDLVIPDNPTPIITGLAFAYAIEAADGSILAATNVQAKAEPGSGGLNTTIDHASVAKSMAESIVSFAECMEGAAVRVRYMPPQEYAEWCDENEDEDDTEPESEDDEWNPEADDAVDPA